MVSVTTTARNDTEDKEYENGNRSSEGKDPSNSVLKTRTDEQYFKGMVVAAPMVRVSTLPFRLLALKYGATLAYSEETIDHALVKCTRKEVVCPIDNLHSDKEFRMNGDHLKEAERNVSRLVQFIGKDNRVIFDTCDLEKNKCVLQIGTSDACRCLQAANIVHGDVAALDINMGCPKPVRSYYIFVHFGMEIHIHDH